MPLEDCFEIDGKYELVDGLYNVEGHVLYNTTFEKLPFKFGKVTGIFDCAYNKLTSLEGCLTWVGGHFSCSLNKLTSLEGGPKWVGGNFSCSHNRLTTLEGGPKWVGGVFFCDEELHNNKEYKKFKILEKLRE